MLSLEERETVVREFSEAVRERFPETNLYNVLLFGSFLTEDYTEASDIDLAVYSPEGRLRHRIRDFVLDYFEERKMACDVIEICTDEEKAVNLEAILTHEVTVTDYAPEELIAYAGKLIEIYGYHPMKKVCECMSAEVGLNDSHW